MSNTQPTKKPAEQKNQPQRPAERDERARKEAEQKRNGTSKPKTSR